MSGGIPIEARVSDAVEKLLNFENVAGVKVSDDFSTMTINHFMKPSETLLRRVWDVLEARGLSHLTVNHIDPTLRGPEGDPVIWDRPT